MAGAVGKVYQEYARPAGRLTVLESSAPGQEDASRARQLRDAVRVATNRMEALSSPGPHDEWALDLDDVHALLVAALGPAPVDDPGATTR